jgi:hypothetical protein
MRAVVFGTIVTVVAIDPLTKVLQGFTSLVLIIAAADHAQGPQRKQKQYKNHPVPHKPPPRFSKRH